MSLDVSRADDLNCSALKPTVTETRLRSQFTEDTINRPRFEHGNNSVNVGLRLVLKRFDFVSTSCLLLSDQLECFVLFEQNT